MTGLFGDAIYLDIPSTYRDVSEFRQVPDNQEVFVDQSSNDSLLVEIMEMVSFSQDHGNFGEYYFNDMASENMAKESKIHSIFKLPHSRFQSLPADAQLSIVFGTQSVAKFNKEDHDIVNIYLFIVRLPSVSTDILISLNSPIALNTTEDVKLENRRLENIKSLESLNQMDDTLLNRFKSIVDSFSIKDFGLFSE